MIIKTRFMTARSEELAAVGKNERGDLFLVFKSGTQHHLKYDDVKEAQKDFDKIDAAMGSDYSDKPLELVEEGK
jgi:hypothetical protein